MNFVLVQEKIPTLYVKDKQLSKPDHTAPTEAV